MSEKTPLETLLQSSRLRDCPIKSRLVFAPVRTGYSLENETERLAHFYRERVEDGAGTVIVGNGVVHSTGKLFGDDFIVDDAAVKHLIRITDAVRDAGGASILQLMHHGALVDSPFPLAASRHYVADTKRTTMPIPGLLVSYVFDWYVKAAKHAVEGAQFDGVEVYAARYSLPNTFTSAALNRRTDRWGGTQRPEFAIELARRLREAIGPDRVLGFRVSLLDLHREGNSWHDLVSLLLRLQTAGVDYFSFDIGFSSNRFPICSDLTPVNTWLNAAAEVADILDVPVVFGKKLAVDERLDEVAQRFPNALFEFARPWLADPQFFKHLQEGVTPNPCLYCKDCLGNGYGNGRPFVCKGQIESYVAAPTAQEKKKLLVVGAGVAGMQAAITAAALGHEVTLVERNETPGGALVMMSRIPGRQRYAQHIDSMMKLIESLGVATRFGYEASFQSLLKNYPEHEYILATGRRPRLPNYEGQGNTNLITYEDLLLDRLPVGHRVLVIAAAHFGLDTTRFLTGLSADTLSPEDWLCAWGIGSLKEHRGGQYGFIPHLATSKRSIYLVRENSLPIDTTLAEHYRAHEMQWLRMCGVQTLEHCDVVSVDPYSVQVHFRETDHDEVLRVDHIVLCSGTEPELDLFKELSDRGHTVYLVGSGTITDEWLDIQGIKHKTAMQIQDLYG